MIQTLKKTFLTIFTSLTRKSSWTQATISKLRETSLTGSFITARVTGTSILTNTKAVFKNEIKKKTHFKHFCRAKNSSSCLILRTNLYSEGNPVNYWLTSSFQARLYCRCKIASTKQTGACLTQILLKLLNRPKDIWMTSLLTSFSEWYKYYYVLLCYTSAAR